MSERDDLMEQAHEAPVISFERRQAAGWVLAVMIGEPGSGYHKPGGFMEMLILAACHADSDNLRRIGQGFPEIARAVDLYKNHQNGLHLLNQEAV